MAARIPVARLSGNISPPCASPATPGAAVRPLRSVLNSLLLEIGLPLTLTPEDVGRQSTRSPLPSLPVPRHSLRMAEQWIAAATALDIIEAASGFGGATRALCLRAHNGLIKSKAQLLVMGDRRATAELVPPSFWWAKGEAALKQNWATGDFSTWIDHRIEYRAFGVTFALGGILDMLPVELRAETQRRLSVAGEEGWFSAAEAAQLAGRLPGVMDGRAYIVEQARLGLLQGQAVLALRFSRPDGANRIWDEREWPIPAIAWEAIADDGDTHQKWDLGQLSTLLLVGGEPQWFRLSGIYILAEPLRRAEIAPTAASDSGPQLKPRTPRPALVGRPLVCRVGSDPSGETPSPRPKPMSRRQC